MCRSHPSRFFEINNSIGQLTRHTSELRLRPNWALNDAVLISTIRRSVRFSESYDRSVKIEALITARLAARAAKNWAESDRIRDELAAMGVALKDNKDGTTTWEVKR